MCGQAGLAHVRMGCALRKETGAALPLQCKTGETLVEARLQKIFESIRSGRTAILLGGDEPLYDGMTDKESSKRIEKEVPLYLDRWRRSLNGLEQPEILEKDSG